MGGGATRRTGLGGALPGHRAVSGPERGSAVPADGLHLPAGDLRRAAAALRPRSAARPLPPTGVRRVPRRRTPVGGGGVPDGAGAGGGVGALPRLALIHISEPTRLL